MPCLEVITLLEVGISNVIDVMEMDLLIVKMSKYGNTTPRNYLHYAEEKKVFF